MAYVLARLGRWSYRRRRLVTALWASALATCAALAVLLSGPTSDSFSMPGAESQEALDVLAERFPEVGASGATARVVLAAPDGASLADEPSARGVREVVDALEDVPGVASVADPESAGTVAPDGSVALAEVRFTMAFPIPVASREGLLAARDVGRNAGLSVEIGGDALEAEPDLGMSEVVGVLVAAVVLLLTFGSLVAAGLPLVTALVGVGIAVALVTAATGFVELGSTTPILATMLGLAVAIDYALFIVSRFRSELGERGARSEAERVEAAGHALGTAGSAVVFAGATVTVGLLAMSVVGVPLLTEMGLAAAVAVVLAVLIALTLLPALMGFAGSRVTPVTDSGRAGRPRGALARRWMELTTGRPVVVSVAAVALLGVASIPVVDLRLSIPDEGTYAAGTTQRKAYDLVREGFGPGWNGPLLAVVDASTADDPAQALTGAAEEIARLDGVELVAPPAVDRSGELALVTVVPTKAPDSDETEALVRDLRALDDRLPGGVDVLVTGYTAVMVDFSERVADTLPLYLALVAALSILLLVLVFRSLLVPLVAVAGFLLSMGATFGALVASFEWGWLSGVLGLDQSLPVVSLLPIFVVGVTFGLAMDYQVFLVTRMREAHTRGTAPVQAVQVGFRHGAVVVVAAAVIMVAVFGSFTGSTDIVLKQIGFALAVGVAVDAFVVRMTLVPAVLTLLGRRAWWVPRWLDRVMPDVDVEGARLGDVSQGSATRSGSTLTASPSSSRD
jgi:RND superfamily putative drug exporter